MPKNYGEFVGEVIRGVHVARARSLKKQFPQSIDDEVVDMCVNHSYFVVEYKPDSVDNSFAYYSKVYPASQFLKASISFERLKSRYCSTPSSYRVPGVLTLRFVRTVDLFCDVILFSYVPTAD